ncbi:MAG: hypothetical protein ACREB3_01770, partial [Burkholderiales bacterium]
MRVWPLSRRFWGQRSLIKDIEGDVNGFIGGTRGSVWRNHASEHALDNSGGLDELARARESGGFRHPSAYSVIHNPWPPSGVMLFRAL